MGFSELITNIYFWMGLTFLFLILFILLFIFLIMLAKKTHAIKEFKAWMKGVPICMFFQDSGYVEWKPIKPKTGLIEDKEFGTYIINEEGTYIDRLTKNVIIPFDAALATSVNIKAAKVADDLQSVLQDPEQLELLRVAVVKGNLDEESMSKLEGLKTSVQVSKIKSMMTALIPHNLTAKIQMSIAAKMKGYGKGVDGMQAVIVFAAILGAIIVGYILLKNVGGA